MSQLIHCPLYSLTTRLEFWFAFNISTIQLLNATSLVHRQFSNLPSYEGENSKIQVEQNIVHIEQNVKSTIAIVSSWVWCYYYHHVYLTNESKINWIQTRLIVYTLEVVFSACQMTRPDHADHSRVILGFLMALLDLISCAVMV